MADNNYYSEGKYRCNHPESDFEKTSTNPIEMKKEKFVEYTHRNETANYRYDVWTGSENATITDKDYYSNFGTTQNYAKTYSINKTTNDRKNPSLSIVFIFILIYILPIIFSVIGAIFSAISDML